MTLACERMRYFVSYYPILSLIYGEATFLQSGFVLSQLAGVVSII